ncbi:MAG: hypothetical protein WA064_00610 [Candidatus Moraniibacteriota bacterium]
MNEENKILEENIKRHIDVMLENVRSDFRIFGEQLSGVSEDVTMLKEDMDYVKSEIVEIKRRFRETDEALGKKVDKETTDDHEKRIIKLENSVLVGV